MSDQRSRESSVGLKSQDREFRPTLSERSRELSASRRDGGNVFNALHKEKIIKGEKRNKLVEENVKSYKDMARQ